MSKPISQLSLFLSFTLLSCTVAAEALPGTAAPNFQGRDAQGVQYRLSDYAGKIVVLEWSSPECPYSRRYYQNGTLDALYEHARKNGIVWINIVPKLQKLTPAQVLAQRDATKNITILDQQLDISSAYGATTTPQIFIIDRHGVLSYSGAIDSTAMLKTTGRKAIPYTRNALDDLLAGRPVRTSITRAFGCYVKNNTQAMDGVANIIPTGSR